MTATMTDAKAGYCGRCRNGQHELCASPPNRCGCPSKDHPNRPTAGRPAPAPTPAPAATADLCGYCRARNHRACTRSTCSCTTGLHPKRSAAVGRAPAKSPASAPVWELVKAAPPAPPPKPKKLTPAELAKPMLEAIVEAGDTDWWRIALFGTTYGAGRIKAVLTAEFPEGWEWKSARDDEGRPAVFVRRVEA